MSSKIKVTLEDSDSEKALLKIRGEDLTSTIEVMREVFPIEMLTGIVTENSIEIQIDKETAERLRRSIIIKMANTSLN